jgi:Xaa-Pro aminopeptidase
MKMQKLKHVLNKKGIDIAIFHNLDSEGFDKNMYYFSGYKGMGCLIVPKRGAAFMIVPLMELERAKKESKIRCYEWEKGKRLFETLKEILAERKTKLKKIGILYDTIRYSVYRSLRQHIKRIKVIDISKECLEIRKIKTREELAILARSAAITSDIIRRCIKRFSSFKTEKDVEEFLHIETLKKGCELAFAPIVASGSAGSMAHHEPRNERLRKGFCVIDFGVKYKGYCSDITRTIYLGKASKKEKEIYRMLLYVQEKVISRIEKGKKCKSSFQETISLLGDYSDNFTHGLGHGLGLNIHELPNLKSLSE